MEEITYMVCVRVADLDEPVEGSTKTACVECGSDLWISAESRKRLSTERAMQVCQPCASRLAAEQGETLPMPDPRDLSPGQLGEIKERLIQYAEDHDKPEWLTLLSGGHRDRFEQLKMTAEMAGAAMSQPTDDWGSMVGITDYEGVDMPPVPLTDMILKGMPKELLAKQLLPAMAQAAQAKSVVFALCPHADGVIEMDDSMLDQLILMEVTADGVQRCAMAPITRHSDSRPELGAWVDLDRTQVNNGLFVDSMVATLQLVRTLRDIT